MLKIHILTNLEKWTNMQNFFNVYGGPLKKLRSVVHGLKKNSDGRLEKFRIFFSPGATDLQLVADILSYAASHQNNERIHA